MHQNKHIPVLLNEVLKYLDPKQGESYLDLTAGYGGHAKAVLEKTKNGMAVLVDRDQEAINYLSQHFKNQNVKTLNSDFLAVSQKLNEQGKQFDLILADLGMSSPHLNTASRGFAINKDGPLDMRMDQNQALTASMVVNNYDQKKLANLIKAYGEEPKAVRLAKAIVENRPIESTTKLANIVTSVIRRRGKTHPATKVFQALRLEVNQELEQIESALPILLELLKPDGRIVIISFHSLEDRLVKNAFKEASSSGYEASLKLLTKHTITADKEETFHNPRARSAKLRAAVKINIKKKGS